MNRRAAKVDSNQSAIVSALRKAGATVHVTSRAHDGFPDLVVEFRGLVKGLEVKDGTLPPSRRQLTEAEAAFHARFPTFACVVTSISDAFAAMGIGVAA